MAQRAVRGKCEATWHIAHGNLRRRRVRPGRKRLFSGKARRLRICAKSGHGPLRVRSRVRPQRFFRRGARAGRAPLDLLAHSGKQTLRLDLRKIGANFL